MEWMVRTYWRNNFFGIWFFSLDSKFLFFNSCLFVCRHIFPVRKLVSLPSTNADKGIATVRMDEIPIPIKNYLIQNPNILQWIQNTVEVAENHIPTFSKAAFTWYHRSQLMKRDQRLTKKFSKELLSLSSDEIAELTVMARMAEIGLLPSHPTATLSGIMYAEHVNTDINHKHPMLNRMVLLKTILNEHLDEDSMISSSSSDDGTNSTEMSFSGDNTTTMTNSTLTTIPLDRLSILSMWTEHCLSASSSSSRLDRTAMDIHDKDPSSPKLFGHPTFWADYGQLVWFVPSTFET